MTIRPPDVYGLFGDRARSPVEEDSVRSSRWADGEAVRETIAGARELVDDAGIPDEPYAIDVAGELRRMVDRMLAGSG